MEKELKKGLSCGYDNALRVEISCLLGLAGGRGGPNYYTKCPRVWPGCLCK